MVLSGTAGTGIESIDPNAVFEGVKVVKLSIRLPYGIAHHFVDLDRGAISLMCHGDITFKGAPDIDVVLGGLRLVEGHGWFPHEKTTFTGGGRTKRMVITSANFDARPPHEAFEIEFDQARSIGNVAEEVSYSRRKRYDLDNLPAANGPDSKSFAKSAGMSQAETSLPGERQPSPPYFTIGGVVIACLIGLIFVVKKLRK